MIGAAVVRCVKRRHETTTYRPNLFLHNNLRQFAGGGIDVNPYHTTTYNYFIIFYNNSGFLVDYLGRIRYNNYMRKMKFRKASK
jgi:hypothetical protein